MNMTIVNLTLRALLGWLRALLLIPLPLVLIGLTTLGRLVNPGQNDWQQPILLGIGFAVIVPVVSLIVGSSVVGSEIDDGTIVYILTKPIPRWQIVMSKLAVAIGVTAVVNGLMLLVCGAIASGPRLAVGLAVGGVVASICYSAVFVALSLLSRRPVLIGLVYILIWEGLLTNLLSGTASLSVEQFGVSLAAHIGQVPYLTPSLSAVTASILSVVFLVVATMVAINRMRAFTMRGETS